MKTFYFIVFLKVFILVSVYPQEFKFKHISGIDGLRSNSINAILQDSYGYMWFGGENGLSRYDGYNIITYKHNSLDSFSISNNYIFDILEDTIPGNLWIATPDGLNYYDSSIGNFSELRFVPIDKVDKVFQKITALFWDSKKSLWVGTGDGIVCLDKNKNATVLFKPDKDEVNMDTYINAIEYWKNDLYFILKPDGLFVFNKSDHTYKKIISDIFISILKDRNNNFWFGTRKDGLWYLSNNSDSQFEHFTPENSELSGVSISAIVEDDLGRIWITVRDKGIEIIDPKSNNRIYLSYSLNNPDGLNSNAGQSMYVDRHKNLWIGTSDEGVNFFDNNKKAFVNYKFNFLETGLRNNNIRSMYLDSDSDIWIGTKAGGCLSRFNRKKGIFEHYKNDPDNPFTLNDDFVFCIAEDRPGYIWVGTFHGGLNLLEKKTGKFTRYPHNPNDPNSVSEDAIYTLCKDSKGRLWTGTDFSGLDVFDKTMAKKNYSFDLQNPKSLSGNRIRYVFEDRNHKIWVGTITGLNLYNEKTDDFERYLHDENDTNSISHNNISCIYEDGENRLWIATYGGGLNLMDRERETFIAYTESDGLANNIILGIVEDNQGNLWLSAVNGVSKFTLSGQTGAIPKPNFRNYDIKDGLQGEKFNLNAFLKTNDGEILFGGSNGFNIFDPEAIKDNQIKPFVNFTDFKLFNKSVEIGTPNSPLKKHINNTRQLVLNHKQSIFSIGYVAINYSSPEKNQYAYMMEGLEEDWNYVGYRREATYTNLRPGTYTFRVKASNNDGLWNEEGRSIVIIILPHPLLTLWAYSIYVIILIAFILFLRYYYLKKIKVEKEHELDQAKLKFFINISHEFRTPLTLISNLINKIMSAGYPVELENSIHNIYRNTHQLLRLINQLLDYRKSELGKLALKAAHLDIVQFTHESISLFEELADAKNVKLKFRYNPSLINVWLDPDKYEKIINNLLSNAIKFCREGDEIIVSISVINLFNSTKLWGIHKRRQEHKPFVEIKVSDTGIGIQKTHIDKIFKGFQCVNESGIGTGIGLNYIKGLIELHKGNIVVESEYGKGSTFTVYLPMGKAHLKEEQISNSMFILNDFSFNVSDIESIRYEISTPDTSISENIDDDDVEFTIRQNLKKNIVLIVEDNKDLRTQIKLEFQNQFTVKEAINGLDAWQKIEMFFPDIIISDVMIPEMDGIELCRKIKSDINTCHIPVILLTAKSLVENQIEGFEKGADEYIVKPFNMDVLKARINNILETRKKLKEKYLSPNTFMPYSELTHNNKDEVFLKSVTKIVLENISDADFTFKELQEQVALSSSSFYRKITGLTNMSPSHFIRHLRIMYAADLLLKNELSIKEICFNSGFNSPSYFNRTFHKVFQKSPLEYLEENIKK